MEAVAGASRSTGRHGGETIKPCCCCWNSAASNQIRNILLLLSNWPRPIRRLLNGSPSMTAIARFRLFAFVLFCFSFKASLTPKHLQSINYTSLYLLAFPLAFRARRRPGTHTHTNWSETWRSAVLNRGAAALGNLLRSDGLFSISRLCRRVSFASQ